MHDDHASWKAQCPHTRGPRKHSVAALNQPFSQQNDLLLGLKGVLEKEGIRISNAIWYWAGAGWFKCRHSQG